MPELPDVETFKQYLMATALHQEIADIEVRSRQMLQKVSAAVMRRALRKSSFVTARRHGKHLFVKVSNGKWVMLHFGMTGFLKYFKEPAREPAHSRLDIAFANGYHLAYDSQRKLGEIALIEHPEVFVKEKKLGPDALDPHLDVDRFKKVFQKTNTTVKTALMDQKRIAGIGNIYSDEILFQAGIRPENKSSKLVEKEDIHRLYGAMKEVLEAAIRAQADPAGFPADFLLPSRQTDGICPRCRSYLESATVAGRTAWYCPVCQKQL